MKRKYHQHTICVQDATIDNNFKSHTLPIYSTSSFDYNSIEDAIDVFTGQREGYVYSRYSNPTLRVVEKKLAHLEGIGASYEPEALLTSSGMSAISTLLAAVLKPGQKILTQGNLYGGTTELLKKQFHKFGHDTIMLNFNNLDKIASSIQSNNIGAIIIETPANPTLNCVDIAAVAQLARTHQCTTIIDNTFATPLLQQPLALGIDFVIHSTTKYINGHGNGIAGVIIGNPEHPSWPMIWDTRKLMGTTSNPWDAWLINNGIKTLALRMEKQCNNAFFLAKNLDQHLKINKVNYPGLQDFEDHSIAKKQMSHYGAMLSIDFKSGQKGALSFINHLELCTIAPTLGDVDTMVLHPATSSHLKVDPKICEEYGITSGLVRISVGIENENDLLNDVMQALEKSS